VRVTFLYKKGSPADTLRSVELFASRKQKQFKCAQKMINGPSSEVDFYTLVLLKTLLSASIIYCSALFFFVASEVRAGESLFSLLRLVANLQALRWA